MRLEEDEQDLRPPGQGDQAVEPVRDPGRPGPGVQAGWQVRDQQVHRPSAEQRGGDREALLDVLRGDHHQPFQPDAAGDGLHRIEAPAQVQPGHDRAGGLGLRDQPEGKRRLAAAAGAAEGEAAGARNPTAAQDRVEGRKTGRDDALR
jgi:hypothetical protein